MRYHEHTPQPHIGCLWSYFSQSSDEASGLHDIAWISNPYSPYTPGEEGEPPAVDEGMRDHGKEAGDDHDREHLKGRVRGGRRIPALENWRVGVTL